jgi:hypothetical protein
VANAAERFKRQCRPRNDYRNFAAIASATDC